jgi:hypothetical protein
LWVVRVMAGVLAWWLAFPASGAEPGHPDSIYVVRRGWHIDIGFAVGALPPPLGRVADRFPGSEYLLFGFGDRRYLTAKHWHVPAMLAAVWPGKGLVLVTALRGTPAEAFGAANVRRFHVADLQYQNAQEHVWQSLGEVDGATANDRLAIVALGPYEGSVYLSSPQRYSAFHTCNTWAAETLDSAGLDVHSRGVLFAGQLWSSLGKLIEKEKITTARKKVGENYHEDPERPAVMHSISKIAEASAE